MTDESKPTRRNDIYAGNGPEPGKQVPAIPAATVVLLRDGDAGVEVLMLHRTSKVHFGGMWVFPGGRIDPDDHQSAVDSDHAARNAAARETREETGLIVSPDEFVCFAHWTPPPVTPRRYATWFFATRLDDKGSVEVDGHEIQAHQWIHPEAMLERHARGEVDLAPPTWITLHHIARYSPVGAVLAALHEQPRRIYETRIVMREDGVRVAMWKEDAGYETGELNIPGPRHRLVMSNPVYTFENSAVSY